MSEQVTRPKNEGRVAAGKRLAEWNRKNKENLLKNEGQVDSSDNPSAQELNSKVRRRQSSMVVGLSQCSPSSVLRFTFITKKSLSLHQHLSLTFFACVNLYNKQ